LRYLIISDIHGNWEALSAALESADGKHESTICCGDIVGYGADPNAVTEWVRAHAQVAIRGNHDRACASLTGIDWFNPMAQAATRWTNRVLTDENREWLEKLPMGPAQVENFQIVHGSPLHEDEYILSVGEASEAFAYAELPLTFFGHTHVQCGFENSRLRTRRWSPAEVGRSQHVNGDAAYLVNPGSVGQPRDGDPRAAFALFDSESLELQLCRVQYDIAAAQQKIIEARLPSMLAQRLSSGN
jgi:predicted phosphodiesterase